SAKKIKQFVTTVNDNFTRKFEAFASDQFRRCVFVGTTNDATPLRDQTGNRRFLPVRVVGEVDLVWARENIDQLLAEAAHLESSGTDFSIPREVWDIAGKHQAAARKSTEAEEQILRWFARPESEDRRYVMSADLGDALRRLKISTNHQFGMVFADLGYSSCEPYIDGRKQNAWATDKDIAGASQWVLNGNGTDVRWVLRTPVAPATPTVPLPPPY
ncbi:MAG: hypothetical protein JWR09_5802, partial [Mucilaginibacter sp.]|nr:hypothetical protein [Mucilaginibacter sp.]